VWSATLPTIKTSPTSEDIAVVYDLFARRAVEAFNEEGSVPSQLYAVVLQEDGTPGQVTEILELSADMLAELFSSPANNRMLTPVTQMFLQDGSPLRKSLEDDGMPLPCLVVQVSEGWAAVGAADPVTSRRDIPPSQRADRQDCLLVVVHTRNDAHIGVCPIQDGPNRQAEYRPVRMARFQNPFGRQRTAGTTHTPLPYTLH
jgi:hypothetical protein